MGYAPPQNPFTADGSKSKQRIHTLNEQLPVKAGGGLSIEDCQETATMRTNKSMKHRCKQHLGERREREAETKKETKRKDRNRFRLPHTHTKTHKHTRTHAAQSTFVFAEDKNLLKLLIK